MFKLKRLKTNFFKKIISFFCLMSLVIINFSGCSVKADEWVKRFGDEEITFSEFLLLVSLKVNDVETEVKKQLKTYDSVTFETIKETEINGVYAFDYLKDLVDKEMNKILAYRWAAKQLKISLNDQEKKALQKDGYNHYKSFNESFKAYKLGISLKACENFILWRALEYKVGEAILQKGKVGEVKPEDIKKFAKSKNTFAKYEMLKVPKNLRDLKIEDPNKKKEDEKKDQNKNEDEKKKEEEKKQEEDQQKIKKHFGVQTGKELADKLLKKANDEKKSLADVDKEIKEGLKGLQNTHVSEEIEYVDIRPNEEKEYKTKGETELKKKIKEEIKTMNVNSVAKIIETPSEMLIIKLKDVDDEVIQKEENKIKGILQSRNKEKYINDIQKKHEKEIETNDGCMKVSIIEKQFKEVHKNKIKMSNFPAL